jgi:hypothetical protein
MSYVYRKGVFHSYGIRKITNLYKIIDITFAPIMQFMIHSKLEELIPIHKSAVVSTSYNARPITSLA